LPEPKVAVCENLKLRLPRGSKRRYYYPDIIVVCSPRSDDKRMIENPCCIFEVLSESTKHIDKGEKLETYQRTESLNNIFW
jgi:Uma2 family endonuclease